MTKHITIPRLGLPRIDEGLIERVLRVRKSQGQGETFYTISRRGRRAKVTRKSDADLYQRMMAAKGLSIKITCGATSNSSHYGAVFSHACNSKVMCEDGDVMPELARDRADWLLDAVAAATQDRRFLRGDPEYDEVAGNAILLNAEKAIATAFARARGEGGGK